MKLHRLQISNFRNFHSLDVYFGDQVVILGENKVGKTNLLYALRLVLDPSLPDSARQLDRADFWDGLGDTLTRDHSIMISVDLTDFEDNDDLLAVLAEHLVQTEPMIARLTYVYQPKPALAGNPTSDADYEFRVYGGGRPDDYIGHDVRRRIPLDVLSALRDAERDLSSWRRSPLKLLLDDATGEIPEVDLQAMAQNISEATARVTARAEINELASRITQRLSEMVGAGQALETSLGFAPTDPARLIRAIRLLIDGGKRGVAEASMGSSNLLYLALKSLELQVLLDENSRDHTFFAIEEPEAHLHPHLQRLVYQYFLHPRSHIGQGYQHDVGSSRTILLTTHSPHIVSVSPLRSIVRLHRVRGQGCTEAVSTAHIDLDRKDEEDVERYLDVTRGEMLFSKAVILVEGDAEQFVIPTLARLLDINLDQFGITVCSISGTNFLPYVKLLGKKALKVPFAILTDFDPQDDGSNLGQSRVLRIMGEFIDAQTWDEYGVEGVLRLAPEYGVFLNTYTFEVDLFEAGLHKEICRTLMELAETRPAKCRAWQWYRNPVSLDRYRLLRDITAIGKGRFAQRLASRLKRPSCPTYISEAIRYVADQCA